MSLPGGVKDVFDLVEKHVAGGTKTAKAILYLFVVAFVGAVCATLILSGKVILGVLPTSLPVNLRVRDWVSFAIVIGLSGSDPGPWSAG